MYPSKSSRNTVELSREDLKCIGEMEFLNDSVVDFFFLHLQHESNFCSETIARVHFFNSFFFHKLVEERKRNLTDPSNYGAAHVRKWTKNLSIANKVWARLLNILPVDLRAQIWCCCFLSRTSFLSPLSKSSTGAWQ